MWVIFPWMVGWTCWNDGCDRVRDELVGGLNPSEKYESQLGWLFPIYGKIEHVPNHQPATEWSKFLGYLGELQRMGGFSIINQPIRWYPLNMTIFSCLLKQLSLPIYGNIWNLCRRFIPAVDGHLSWESAERQMHVFFVLELAMVRYTAEISEKKHVKKKQSSQVKIIELCVGVSSNISPIPSRHCPKLARNFEMEPEKLDECEMVLLGVPSNSKTTIWIL